MKPLTLEWIGKAEGDFATMERGHRVRKNPVFDAICFHAQQCAEKYFKARLQEAGLPIPRTHDLEELHDLVLRIEPLWILDKPELAWLTGAAVEFRYPGESADREDARRAVKIARAVRRLVRSAMGVEQGRG